MNCDELLVIISAQDRLVTSLKCDVKLNGRANQRTTTQLSCGAEKNAMTSYTQDRCRDELSLLQLSCCMPIVIGIN